MDKNIISIVLFICLVISLYLLSNAMNNLDDCSNKNVETTERVIELEKFVKSKKIETDSILSLNNIKKEKIIIYKTKIVQSNEKEKKINNFIHNANADSIYSSFAKIRY